MQYDKFMHIGNYGIKSLIREYFKINLREHKSRYTFVGHPCILLYRKLYSTWQNSITAIS